LKSRLANYIEEDTIDWDSSLLKEVFNQDIKLLCQLKVQEIKKRGAAMIFITTRLFASFILIV